MRILARLTLQDRSVNSTSGPTYAPHLFAKEKEAKAAKMGKATLEAAMRRLFDANRIRVDEYNRDGHVRRGIVAV